MEAIQEGLAQRESLQMETGLSPFIRADATEEQLPITPIAPTYAGGFTSNVEEIPETYSTDEE